MSDPMKPVTTIGARLRGLRKKNNKTLQAVSAATHTGLTFLCDIEHGNSYPSLHTCQRLADYYGIGLSEMFNDVYVQVKP